MYSQQIDLLRYCLDNKREKPNALMIWLMMIEKGYFKTLQ